MSTPVLDRMQSRIDAWGAADERALFLSCYRMMTGNVVTAVERREFDDPAWVGGLLHRFADYYFDALDAFETEPQGAPAVWRMAHRLAADPEVSALQKMLLGVSAHINYDLVLTLVDVLEPEWPALGGPQRQARYADHCRINAVIARTVDAVQEAVLSPAMPAMGTVDRWLGPLDEMLIARLLSRWRETVWHNATAVLDAADAVERARLVAHVERLALRTGRIVCPRAAALV
jgi:hypothetical protein